MNSLQDTQAVHTYRGKDGPPPVSEKKNSVAWLSAGAVTAAIMVAVLNGGFPTGLRLTGK